ncbi:MAG: hypothetical protein M1816_006177 [Peltula sp. TS41687]|nr:MAG: hypothetical protein M1816_006177 [Peltula sp. TS41687]
MADSPPKRITRSRTKAAELSKPPSKPMKTTSATPRATSAAKGRAVPALKPEPAKVTKPATRTAKSTVAAPKATNATKPKAVKSTTATPRATSTAKETAVADKKIAEATTAKLPEKAVKMPTSAMRMTRSAANRQVVSDDKPEVTAPAKSTRGRPTKTADRVEPQLKDQTSSQPKSTAAPAAQPPKRARGRPKKVQDPDVPMTEAPPRLPSPTPAAAPPTEKVMRGVLAPPSRGNNMAKKKVTFASPVIAKENEIPHGLKRSADEAESDAINKPRGLNAKPIRRPASIKSALAKKAGTPEATKEPEKTEAPQPLSPKKVQQNALPDLSSPAKRPPPSPFKNALKESPKKINIAPMSPSFLAATIPSTNHFTDKLLSPTKPAFATQPTASLLASPPKRASQMQLHPNTPSQMTAAQPTVNLLASPPKKASQMQPHSNSSSQMPATQPTVIIPASPPKMASQVQPQIDTPSQTPAAQFTVDIPASPPKMTSQMQQHIDTPSQTPDAQPTITIPASPSKMVSQMQPNIHTTSQTPATEPTITIPASPPKMASQMQPNINTPSQTPAPTPQSAESPVQPTTTYPTTTSLASPPKGALQMLSHTNMSSQTPAPALQSSKSPVKPTTAHPEIDSVETPRKWASRKPVIFTRDFDDSIIDRTVNYDDVTMMDLTIYEPGEIALLPPPPPKPRPTPEFCIDPVLLEISAQQQAEAAKKAASERPVIQEPSSTIETPAQPWSMAQQMLSDLTGLPQQPISPAQEQLSVLGPMSAVADLFPTPPPAEHSQMHHQAPGNTPERPAAQGLLSVPGPLPTVTTPTKTPRPAGFSQILRGAVVFVDVYTAEGANASSLFIESLTQMGARCVRQWNWNPNNATSSNGNLINGTNNVPRIGITHVVFKDGGKRTMEKVRASNGVVSCVGVAWVLDCERQNTWLDESAYAVDPTLIPRGGRRRQKSMEPKPLPPSIRSTPSSTNTAALAKRFLDLDSPLTFDIKNFDINNYPGKQTPQVPTTPKTPHFPTTESYSDISDEDEDEPVATPYFLKPSSLIQQTCPPKPSQQVNFAATGAQPGSLNFNHGGSSTESRQKKRALESDKAAAAQHSPSNKRPRLSSSYVAFPGPRLPPPPIPPPPSTVPRLHPLPTPPPPPSPPFAVPQFNHPVGECREVGAWKRKHYGDAPDDDEEEEEEDERPLKRRRASQPLSGAMAAQLQRVRDRALMHAPMDPSPLRRVVRPPRSPEMYPRTIRRR